MPASGCGRSDLQNILGQIETTVVLDTNLLIEMEYVVRNGNKRSLLKDRGLHNFVDLMNRLPAGGVFLSPRLALAEMPPTLAERSVALYEEFCAKHLPGFMDTPNSTRSTFSGKVKGFGYLDLDEKEQAVLALPFCALLYLNLIDKLPNLTPIQKFKKFLERLVIDLDILSNKEIEIAKYCFAEHKSTSTETIDIRRALRSNFLKTKKDKSIGSFEDAVAVAFNGASDLMLINSANVVETRGLDGVKQDCWIATRDRKLFAFSKIFHGLNLDGDAGKFTASSVLSEHEDNDYWKQANAEQESLINSRVDHHNSRKLDVFAYLDKAKAAIAEVQRYYSMPANI